MSSVTAVEMKNTLMAAGTRLPRMASSPSTKAVSVPMGMPQPTDSGLEGPTMNRKISAGNAMPPMDAPMGSRALRGLENSPPTNSRLSSRATTKKNMAIRPSLIRCSRSFSRMKSPTLIPTNVVQNW